MGLIIPSLMNFTRVMGGVRENVCVQTAPESEAHPRVHDMDLLNELLCWFHTFSTHDYRPTCQITDHTILDSREPHQRKKLIDVTAWRQPHSPENFLNVLNGHQGMDTLPRKLSGLAGAWTRTPTSLESQRGGFAPALSLQALVSLFVERGVID